MLLHVKYRLSFKAIPSFWENYLDCWEGYDPDDLFSDSFGVTITISKGKTNEITDPTLIEALNAARQDVTYPLTGAEIIETVYEVITNADLTDGEPIKNMQEMYNDFGGGVDTHYNPI
jgi:hypothetical protein